jgi:hypothetical protein
MAENNQIKVVRAIAKLSSLIHNIDNLKDNYPIPNKMLRDICNFDNWFQENTNDLMIELFKHKPEVLEDIIEWFNDYDERYAVEESMSKQVVLLRSKMHSVIYDLLGVEFPKELTFPPENYTAEQKDLAHTEKAFIAFSQIICSRLQTILDKGYFKRIPYKEKDIHTLYVSMNETGEKILFAEKEVAD